MGADRRTAIARHPTALAALQHRVGLAEQQWQRDNGTVPGGARYPMSIENMAWQQYQSLIEFDLELRQHYPVCAAMGPDPYEARRYRDGFSGKLNDLERDELVGDRIKRFRLQGNTDALLGTPERRKLAMALGGAMYEAMSRQHERDEGDFNGQPSIPMLHAAEVVEIPQQAVSLTTLLDDFLKEREATGRGREARRKWTPSIADFVALIGHDDARRITKADIIRWKDAKLESGLAASTFKRGHFAALNAVLRWAHENDRIDANPADGVRLRVPAAIQNREKGFREDEAKAILAAAKDYDPSPSEDRLLSAAKRWAPWLCAFTGARLGEIVQLRRQDVFIADGMHIMRITPEAGTVKTGKYRDVPIHQQLVDDGFLDYTMTVESGPLFLRSSKGRSVEQASRTVQNQLREWIKSTVDVPAGVSPFHGWRHRFKTVGRELGIDTIVLDAIQGHARRTAGDNYGDITLKAKKAAIDKFPNQ